MSMKSAFRRLSRAFNSKDSTAFDDALEELEEKMEEPEAGKDEKEPEIEIHNHIPPSEDRHMDDRRHDDTYSDDRRHDDRRHDDRRHDDRRMDDAPPWFKKFSDDTEDRFRRIHDALRRRGMRPRDESFEEWAAEEAGEPEHLHDQLENLGRYAEPEKDRRHYDHYNDPNLEMDRRHDDRRHDDTYSDDRRHDDRRMDDRRHNDRHLDDCRMDDRRHDDRRHDDRRHDDRRHDDRRHDGEPEWLQSGGGLENEDRSRDGRRRMDDQEANRAILGELEFEAPPGTGDRVRRARDSACLEESFQDALSKAEVLVPGLRLPTFDRSASPLRTAQAIFGLRRTTLDLAYSRPETRGLIEAALSGRALDTRNMRVGEVRVLFNSIAASAAAGNNSRATDTTVGLKIGGSRIRSLADINTVNREHFRKSA